MQKGDMIIQVDGHAIGASDSTSDLCEKLCLFLIFCTDDPCMLVQVLRRPGEFVVSHVSVAVSGPLSGLSGLRLS